MAYSIVTPTHSFVRFDNEGPVTHCVLGEFQECLQVYAEDDYKFQFVIEADTEEEADAISQFDANLITIGMVADCGQEDFDVTFSDPMQRFRLNAHQVLVIWEWGMPGMIGFYDIDSCFYLRVDVDGEQFCSNCFKRIGDDCYTSVIEYGNDEDFAGFYYCNTGTPVDPDAQCCNANFITFINKSTLTIPYTTALRNKYGEKPDPVVWIYNELGLLTRMFIQANFNTDTEPISTITFNFGGPASGVIVFKN